MDKARTIMIMAGGTGGHVIPGLTAAKVFQDAGHHVVWLGTEHGLEASLVPQARIKLYTIKIWGLRGKSWITWCLAPIKLFFACMGALKIMRKAKPDIVIGCGGFASGPGGIAAVLLRKPLYLHEQNAVAGLTNRILARVATGIYEAFPGSFSAKRQARCIGNPVRSSIVALAKPEQRFANREGPLRLLVLGGSLGAQTINERVVQWLATTHCNAQVWHQTGKGQFETMQKAYQQQGLTPYRLEPFIEEMASAYGWADLVLTRAGALTVSEIEAVGLAAIFVPYPYAVDDHQYKNAKHLADKNAAIIVRQDQFSIERLETICQNLMSDRPQLLAMAQSGRNTMPEDPAQVLAKECLAL